MKKLLAMVLALVMTLSLAVSASAFKDDKDISADYAEAVAVLDGMGVFKGYEDGSFKPTGDITRAEVATIIYRIYTGDVAKSDKSGLYATYNKFSDMTGAGWAAGYIGYCANAELVKGYPDGTFKPSGKITGYEVLAMILRAVGYDKNGEFSGADWALNVAKYAEQLGILKNVAKTTNLGAPATRELVAEMLFRAIQSPVVTYTPAFGYQTDKVQKLDQTTLGYKNFKLADADDEDVWGRPTTKWYKDSDKDLKYDSDETVYAEITATPDASFNVETSECDICEALGVKKTTTVVDTYTNGVKDTKDVTYTATATKAMVGAQGRQLEYYEVDGGYRLVVIDTYLAKVDSVKDEKTDTKGHVTSDAYMNLTVYTNYAGVDYVVKGDDYAKGDYVLVNVNKDTDNNVKIVGFTAKQPLVEIVGKAESFDGAQSKLWRNSNKHTIADKDYMDAVEFNHDEAQKSTIKFTWFLDQFGNLIGSVALDRSNYAVLKDIIWNVGRPGSAEATLISMVDGKEYTATVDTFDGFSAKDGQTAGYWMADKNDEDPYHTSSSRNTFGYVGEELSDNDMYRGLAMYRVDTNDDGTVNLEGIESVKKNDQNKIVVDKLYVNYVENVSVDVKTSAIVKGGSEEASLTKSTNFIIRDGKGTKADPFTYELKTGTKELPAMKNVDLFYVDSDKDGFVDFVYVVDYISATLDPSYVFAYTTEASEDFDADIFTVNVYVNGEKQDIDFNAATYKTLKNNLNKLFVAEFNATTGVVDTLTLVTEDNDRTLNKVEDTVVDYVTGDFTVSNDNETIKNVETTDGTMTYVVAENGFKFVSTVNGYDSLADLAKLDAKDLKTLGIGVWVVAEKDGTHKQATTVYVGDRLTSTATSAVDVLNNLDLGTITLTDATLDTLNDAFVDAAKKALSDAGYSDVTVKIGSTKPTVPDIGTTATAWAQIDVNDGDGYVTANGVHASVVNNYSETSLKAAVEAKIAATRASVANYATKELWVAAAQQAVVNDLGVTSCKLTLTSESMLGWTAGATYSVAYSVVYNTATYTGTTSITVVA
ncbi:MAG: S-layer homology domain-containing protein [Oscillospiraceae bacterium]|nr:S-layer homology domain-containing protein [Oscillospiraceae bacterium]